MLCVLIRMALNLIVKMTYVTGKNKRISLRLMIAYNELPAINSIKNWKRIGYAGTYTVNFKQAVVMLSEMFLN